MDLDNFKNIWKEEEIKNNSRSFSGKTEKNSYAFG